ncbi:uncharacterized protein LOC116613817 [Nematostella vectensis]|uniref:uncharacterized protein LOC116613817 n=1 Tax=Nematostella vectensis TaxID=45351 RepID=UPI00139001FD|nr:uncharacterized protein LOC116613817 [Nematostella vectensis]
MKIRNWVIKCVMVPNEGNRRRTLPLVPPKPSRKDVHLTRKIVEKSENARLKDEDLETKLRDRRVKSGEDGDLNDHEYRTRLFMINSRSQPFISVWKRFEKENAPGLPPSLLGSQSKSSKELDATLDYLQDELRAIKAQLKETERGFVEIREKANTIKYDLQELRELGCLTNEMQ